MNKRIYFIRTAPYEYLIPGNSLYQSFNMVAKKKIEVTLKYGGEEYFKENMPKRLISIKSVYCSPRIRSIETAQILTDKLKVSSDLQEVGFAMEDFIEEKNFYDKQGNPKVQKARKGFVAALIKSKLQEKYPHVITRIEGFFKVLSKDSSEKIIVFSHGFYMKILEAYVRDSSIKDSPSNLIKYFDGSSETFKFCEGFVLDYKAGEYKFHAYIRNKGQKNE